jgi:hypothetical protein
MKRDIDLIRKIMLTLEENMEYGKNFQSVKLFEIMEDESLSIEKLSYHIGLLLENGLIQAKEHKYVSKDPTDYLINTITSQGHNFIDTIRQDTTWNNIKERAFSIGGSSISLLVEISKEYLKKQIIG